MNKKKLNQNGFTVIELMVFILIVAVIAVIAISNIRTVRAENRDTASKRDVNAIYFQLESFHERNGFYPKHATEKNLKGIDPENLIDHNGTAINQEGSLYSYNPSDCTKNECESYELSVPLEREAQYVKQSLNK